MKSNYLCGLSCWHPTWLQRFASSRSFIMVYGFLGTTQAMAYIYFVITLTTLEKRFKIPSSTTGIILSGNEISQILLSLILSYVGGHRNRPRWIAWGVVFCALSCFILALPHFIYGAGESALQLTKEYINDQETEALLKSHNLTAIVKSTNRLCMETFSPKECHDIISVVPLILIFMSQFVLGIGNTLYYSLGQTYLDDNTKKTNTPLMLAYASSLRTFGPVVGFALGYFALKVYIDPTKTPVIDSSDPRWLGAWWLGWIILGMAMLVFAALIGLFPKELPTNKVEPKRPRSNEPVVRMNDAEAFGKEKNPLSKPQEQKNVLTPNGDKTGPPDQLLEFPQLKDFPKALLRLLKNKLLMFNIISGIFYILGSSGYITFLSKYIEVQFHKTTANATVITGPITLFGMVAGFLISGIIISKKKPSPKLLLFWNVIVGIGYMVGQLSYLFLTCPDGNMPLVQGGLNLTTECNSRCHCDGIPYSPVCQEETGITFFSACHAGCDTWNAKGKYYKECTCQNENYSPITKPWVDSMYTNAQKKSTASITEKAVSLPDTSFSDSIITTTPDYTDYDQSPKFKSKRPQKNSSGSDTSHPHGTTGTTHDDAYIYDDEDYFFGDLEEAGGELNAPTSEQPDKDQLETQRRRRDMDENNFSTTAPSTTESPFTTKLIPGACLKGCALGFYLFSIISSIINCFGASGRIGNLLVNYRCVAKEDKSITQGLILMMISLFALIPGPILYGRIIDSTCLVWTEECGKRGNCQLYDQRLFRYYINLTALGLTAIGVFFDTLVWWYGRTLDLYGDQEAEQQKAKTNSPPKNAFT